MTSAESSAVSRSRRGRLVSASIAMVLAVGASTSLLAQAETTATAAASKADQPVILDKYTVVTSGIRASLMQALEIKRESVQIVDSIVSEDIGKFPDNNLVESMQRMTGI